ncbi:arc-like DNA binding domain [Caudoviricetes sp.]|nr:arc-like DNA binding domain [Caudoviricetes sp.]
MFAAVGSDGFSCVVWGIGKTHRAAVRNAERESDVRMDVLTDARPRWDRLGTNQVYVLPISGEQATRVRAGEVDAVSLGIIDRQGTVCRGTGAPSEQYLATRWDRLSLRLARGNKARLEAYAERRGMTVGAAIDEWIRSLE